MRREIGCVVIITASKRTLCRLLQHDTDAPVGQGELPWRETRGFAEAMRGSAMTRAAVKNFMVDTKESTSWEERGKVAVGKEGERN